MEEERLSLKEKRKKKDSDNKSKIKSIIASVLSTVFVLIIVGLLMYWRVYRLFTPEEIDMIKEIYNSMTMHTVLALVGAILFYVFGFSMYFYYRKKNKDSEIKTNTHKYIFKILIESICVLFVVWGMFTENILYNIYIFSLAFGLMFMFFELFSRLKSVTLNKITSFPLAFIFRFCIPMMPILIILLGVVQGMYPSDSIFLSETSRVFGADTMIDISDGGSFGGIVGYVGYRVVSILYNMGESRPMFMLGLCALAALILFYLTIYKHFIKEVPPLSFVDDVTEEEAIKSEKERNEKKKIEDKISDKEPIEILPDLLEIL